MILVNGADGIGTGWATTIPCYNPSEIIKNIEEKLKDKNFKFVRMNPWYKNFLGEISYNEAGSFTVKGVWKKIDKYTIEITELPVKKWIRDYKNFLEELMMSGLIIDEMKEFHKDNTVHFVLKLKEEVSGVDKSEGGIEKKLKL
jgi:DNA topoisomerase-2